MHHPIVTCARGWIGTRFHHQGRVKKTENHKGGVDCLGLLIGVAKELDLRAADGRALADHDDIHYSHQPDTKHLHAQLAQLLQPIARCDIKPGDVVLMRIDDSPQHLAIISDNDKALGLIHAYAPARAVVEHALDDWWRERIVAGFLCHCEEA